MGGVPEDTRRKQGQQRINRATAVGLKSNREGSNRKNPVRVVSRITLMLRKIEGKKRNRRDAGIILEGAAAHSMHKGPGRKKRDRKLASLRDRRPKNPI